MQDRGGDHAATGGAAPWFAVRAAWGLSRNWGDQAATANCGPAEEAGSNRWPNPEPSAPL
jgi:hypothetical protein